MFNKEDYYLIGTLSKTHGISGELLIKPGNLAFDDIEKMESVFIEFDGLLVPFFIDHITQKGQSALAIKFDGIDAEEQASEFINCKVYSTKLVEEEEGFLFNPDLLIGFKIIDNKLGDLGIVSEFVNISKNPLFKIIKSKREIFLPVNEEFIMNIDEKNKIIYVNTPEGLIDLYTKN